jgi:hypothetical protein
VKREPRWCDLDCPHASFPEKEALDGACHTFIALYCAKLGRLVHKNAPCRAGEGEGDDRSDD